MQKSQTAKRSFAAIGRRMIHKLSHQLVPNAGTLVIMALLLFTYHAWAGPSAAPQVTPASEVNAGLLSYQGYLTDTSGEPLAGDVDITFRLYDAPSGGTALWTEAHTGDNAVPVEDGLFNVMLGSLTPIPDDVWSSGASYLGIEVGDDAEMSPREAIGSVPTAMTVPDGAIGTTQIANGAIKTEQIADGAVTASKVTLSHDYVVGEPPDNDDPARRFYLDTSFESVPGLSFSVNPTTDQVLNLDVMLDATAVSGSGPIVGLVYVNGSSRGRPIVFRADDVRASISLPVQINLSPGSYTIDFKVRIESGSGSYLYSENCVMTYTMFAQ